MARKKATAAVEPTLIPEAAQPAPEAVPQPIQAEVVSENGKPPSLELVLKRELDALPATATAIVPIGRLLVTTLGAKLMAIQTAKLPELAAYQAMPGKVTDQATCTTVSANLAKLKEWEKEVANEFSGPADIFNKLHKAITGTRGALLDPAATLEKSWGGELLRHDQKCKAEEARRQEEQRREAERKADLAAEQVRLAALDEEMILPGGGAPAVDPEEAARAAREKVLAENMPAPVQAAPTFTGGLNPRNLPWAAEILDVVTLLRWVLENPADRIQFIEVNQTLLNTMARQHKAALAIPGVRAYQGQTLSSR